MIINGLGGKHTDTDTHTHTVVQTKAISRNQAHTVFGCVRLVKKMWQLGQFLQIQLHNYMEHIWHDQDGSQEW